ncbi:SPFH domain-containing protein [Gimesia chilikensis]|uniref:SPFH domain / Band 7 family protein n=1 Tax=Gimesia chilikensis TaxID=2605989 RepID=A0A517PT90_9PLAN|nr:SPFH domain-containing protein [Gimesia chilikensis]MBN69968.1 band 7 protein [Gimesia sp.]QDT22581.1 SPFH domain / Band 7 family protein [Gimesia chilikensis]QDT86496.1 SPFH domain / Band 7 family protein [Gimesia chilikensis]
MQRSKLIIIPVVVLSMMLAIAAFLFHWTIDRIYVPEGQSLQLRYKGPLIFGDRIQAEPGMWAKEGQMGILEKMRGPGRHFYCPIWWERKLVDDVVIKPGEIGEVTCKLGKNQEGANFLVDGDIGHTEYKGVLRKVLHPGRYRVNPYGYTVEVKKRIDFTSGQSQKVAGWVEIPTGYVGVVTQLSDNQATGVKKGVQDKVLPPGNYPVNGREQQIDIVEIGYRHSTISVEVKHDELGETVVDENGEPQISDPRSGIAFPSADGFPIHIDFTGIWGLMPDQAAHAVRTFGNVDQVEKKVVLPQIESICRNNGSEYKAVQLLVGSDREVYQKTCLDQFHSVLDDKEITLLYGLVRHVYIPKQVREPIQRAFIADELKLTREEEQSTAKEEARLREAENKVELATDTVNADTEKQVEEAKAGGQREAAKIEAETEKLVAAIDKETEELKAQAVTILGEATNEGKKMVEEAKSDRFRLAVDAFGSPQAYNNWYFATNLPDNVELNFLYAGEGTLWTDMNKANGGFGVRGIIPLKSDSTAPTQQRPTR